MEAESHISSLIVYANPGQLDTVASDLQGHEYVEIAACSHEQGKIVCVIDTPSLALAETAINRIKQHPLVNSAVLVYHHAESNDSLDSLMPSTFKEHSQ